MKNSIVHSLDPVALVGGADIGPDELNIFQSRTRIFVGVDRGADHLQAAGINPTAVIGDLDSLSQQARAAFHDVLHHVPEQDTVDFEKALTRVQAPLIYAVGFWGGRVDHSLAVLNVLGRHAERNVVLVGPDDVSVVMPKGGVELALEIGTTVSLMPLGPSQITTTGLRWDVTDFDMDPLGKTSSSNEAAEARVTLQATGCVLLTVPLSHLLTLETAVVRG